MNVPDQLGPISPNDHMMTVAPEHYGPLGLEAVKLIKGALGFSYLALVERVLDFGCGHGRVLRHLRPAFPGATVWGADIDRDAVAFCTDHLGAHPAFSTDDFARLDLPPKLDLIWVGSVFTHISLDRAQALFDQLTASLGHGGVLVGTFHGRRVIEHAETSAYIQPDRWTRILQQYQISGWGHAAYADQEKTGFGVSLSNPSAVMGLAAGDPALRLITYAEAAWGDHQDVAAWMRWPRR
jgi:SAM-dependent methyltransferase